MLKAVSGIREAWRLYQSDSVGETVLAGVVLVVVVGPLVWKLADARGDT